MQKCRFFVSKCGLHSVVHFCVLCYTIMGDYMRILICDDEQAYIQQLKTHIEKFMQEHSVTFQIDTESDAKTVFESDSIYQIAFLDIQMNEINGISLAKELKGRNSKVVIFFITSYNQYQDDAMDLRAFRFFEKPFNPERLYSGLEKAMEYIDESYVDFYLYSDKSQCRVLVDDVIYVERQNRKVVLNTVQGQYITSKKLEEWCEILPGSFFYQVHKSFLVNLHYVERYNYTELFLTDGARIPIASRKQANFHKYWFQYLRRR